MKKTLSLILSLVLVISSIAVFNFTASAGELYSSGSLGTDITYTVDKDTGVMTLTGTGATNSYSSSPFSYNTTYSNTTVTKLVIGEGITAIGDYVFNYFTALKDIEFPDTLEKIGFYSFGNCTSLTEVSFPDSVTTIDRSAFSYSSNITKITIGKGVKSIDGSSFNTTSLKEFVVDPENIYYASVDGNLYNASKTQFIKYAAGKTASEFTIPDFVTSIAGYAFSSCLKSNPLKKLTVPGSVKTLDFSCFRQFESLEEIVLSEGVEAIDGSVFMYCYSLKTLTLPESMKKLTSGALWDSYIETLNIPKGVTSLTGCLYHAKYIATVTVDPENPLFKAVDNVIYSKDGKTLYGYALGKTDTDFIIPDGVETIEYGAFDFSSLKSVTIPETVKTINTYAFHGMSNVTEFNIPKSVTSIGQYAFNYNNSCTKIVINNPYCKIFDNENTFKGNVNSTLVLSSYTKCDGSDSTLKAYVDKYSSTYTNGYTDLGTTDHEYGTPVSNDDGTHTYTCVNCGATKSESCTISTVAAKAATCTENGYTAGEECSVCGYMKIGEAIPATGHDYVTTETLISAASCTATGLKEVKSVCSECSDTTTSYVTISKIPHNMVTIAEVPATCTENGLTEYNKCSVCGYISVQPTLIIAGHKSDEGSVTTEPTCTTAGTKTYRCTVCNETIETESVPALGHTSDEGTITTAPTCISTGTKTYRCTVCGEVINTESIPALGHTSDEGTIAKVATCSSDGEKVYKCTVCGETVNTETIPATAHTVVVDKAVSATCTTAGKTAGSHCSVCNTIIKAQTVVPATGHTSDKGTVTKAATCTTKGTKTYKCTVCGAVTKTATIKATGHKAVTLKARTATVKQSGLTAGSKCSVCGKVLTKQTMTLAQGTGLKASTVKTTSITLKWTAVNGAKYYKLEQYNASTKKWTAIKTTTATSYTVSKLTAGTTYKFRVTALDSTKKIAGKASATLTAYTLCSAPTIKLTSTKSKTATVTITKVTGAKSYTIYKSTDGKKWTKVTTTTKTTYNLTGLTAGNKIYVKVLATNTDGKVSAYSAVKSVTVKK